MSLAWFMAVGWRRVRTSDILLMLNGMDLLLDCSGGKKKGGERITLTLQALLAGKMLQLPTACLTLETYNLLWQLAYTIKVIKMGIISR